MTNYEKKNLQKIKKNAKTKNKQTKTKRYTFEYYFGNMYYFYGYNAIVLILFEICVHFVIWPYIDNLEYVMNQPLRSKKNNKKKQRRSKDQKETAEDGTTEPKFSQTIKTQKTKQKIKCTPKKQLKKKLKFRFFFFLHCEHVSTH